MLRSRWCPSRLRGRGTTPSVRGGPSSVSLARGRPMAPLFVFQRCPRRSCNMTFSEMMNIGLMQGFAGLSLFAVLLLMGLGLAIIFGQMGATVSNRIMANAIGIDTQKTDRLTFAIGCGIAGVAGAAFTTIGSTGPTSGSLY